MHKDYGIGKAFYGLFGIHVISEYVADNEVFYITPIYDRVAFTGDFDLIRVAQVAGFSFKSKMRLSR